MNHFNKIVCIVLACQLLTISVCFAQEEVKKDIVLQDIALPSDVKDIGKQQGAIYYDTASKNRALVPTHFWGEVQRSGLHFIPTDTTLVKALSMAGGPTGSAKLEEVTLNRLTADGSVKQYHFDISGGGGADAHTFKVESGDSIFIKRDTFYENRNYYTSWVSIALSLITTFFIVNRIR
jgi:hypothetical protein